MAHDGVRFVPRCEQNKPLKRPTGQDQNAEWASVGSTNFDNRSFALNEELNLTVYDAGITRRLEAAFDDDLRYARKISYEEWNSRGIGERLFEWFSFPVRETYNFGKDLRDLGPNSKRLDAQPKASGTRIIVSPKKMSPTAPGSRKRLSIWRPASVSKITPGILPITLARTKCQKRILAAPTKKLTSVKGETGNTRRVRTMRNPCCSAVSSTRCPQNRANLVTISCPIRRPMP